MLYVVKKITKAPMLFILFMFLGISLSFSQQEISATEKNTTKYLYGIASWYGDSFDGQTTASGTPYSSSSLTAAHRSLPFGTRVEVENLSNGKKVQAIINDRGPFEQNRVLTLSKQAAEILEFLTEGTTFVKITILELGTSLPSPIGLPKPPIGKDIPQNFSTPPPSTVVEPNITEGVLLENETLDEDLLNDLTLEDDVLGDEIFSDDLFADLDDELDFMDDSFESELINEDPQLKGQVITNTSLDFADNNPAVDPIGFDSTPDEIFINDPLSNIVIAPEDEFFVAPQDPPIGVYDTAPYGMTPEEKRLLRENASTDPFEDLFEGSSVPYSFQDEVNTSLTEPIPYFIVTNEANNIDGNLGQVISSPPVINEVNNINENLGQDLSLFETPPTQIITNSSIQDDFYGDYDFNDEIISPQIPEPPVVQEPPMQRRVEEPIVFPSTPTTKAIEEPLVPQKLGNHYIIQLGAFSKQKNALDLYQKIREGGFNAYITDVKVKGNNLMRVRVGYFTTIDEAIIISQQLEQAYQLENRIIKIDYEDTDS